MSKREINDPGLAARMQQAIVLAKNINQLATKSGVDAGTIKKYASGKRDPQRASLVAIADAVGVNVEWLATGRGPMHPTGAGTTYPVGESGVNLTKEERPVERARPGFESLVEDLLFIMKSDDEGTKIAIAQNIAMFKESVWRKRQLDEAAAEIDFKTQECKGGNGE
jgi:transcriptional regulator with XRE-family HTH domain